MDIFDIIKRDHATQRNLGKKILDNHDLQQRKDVYRRYRENLKTHAMSEERYFYIALLADDKSQKEARHSIAEHHDIDELIEEVDKANEDQWKARFTELHKMVIHHLEEEEIDVFPIAREVLSDRQKEDLAVRYEQMMTSLMDA